MSTFNAMHFIENARAKKRRRKKKRKIPNLFKLHFFSSSFFGGGGGGGGLFSGTLCHGSGGVNRTSHKMYLLNMQSPKHTEG